MIFLLILLFITIPISFAEDNLTGEAFVTDEDILQISDDMNVTGSGNNEILKANDVYFDASAVSDGSGTQSSPYKTISSSKLGSVNHASYKIRVFADNGNPVGAGESVVIKVDGKKVKTLTTDKDGYVTYKTSKTLAVKTHKITAEYKGVSVTNKLVVKQVIKAKNTSFKKSKKTKKYTATLKTSKGKAIKGKKVTFKIKGKTYTAKTNKKGVATIKVTNLKKTGKYSVLIKYSKTSVKKTITIKK